MHVNAAMPALVAGGNGFGDGFGGGGLLALALLAGRGGFGFGDRDGRRDGEGCVSNATFTAGMTGVTDAIQNTNVIQGIGDLKGAINQAEANTQLALSVAQSDITQQTQAQTVGISNQIFAAQLANCQGFANTKDAVDALSTQVAVGQGVTNTNIERLGWQLSRENCENTQKILNQLSSDRIADLEQRLTVAQLDHRHERDRNDRLVDKQSVDITMVNNQNQNQLQFQQQQQSINSLINCVHGLGQNIQAQNIAINNGGMQHASPNNTSTNIR